MIKLALASVECDIDSHIYLYGDINLVHAEFRVGNLHVVVPLEFQMGRALLKKENKR